MITRATVGIIGPGRAGSALARGLFENGWTIGAISGRTHDSAALAALADELSAMPAESATDVAASADLIFVAVPDSAIESVVGELEEVVRPGTAVAHLSGAMPVQLLDGLALRGAVVFGFHPVLPFADHKRGADAFLGAPIGIAGPERGLEVAVEVADSLGAAPFEIDDSSRALYHAACATASNAFVALQDAANQMALAAGVEDPRQVLLPLVRATLANLEVASPSAALTGPVKRGDATTVAGHLDAIEESLPHLAPLYRALSLHALEIASLDPSDRAGVEAALAPARQGVDE